MILAAAASDAGAYYVQAVNERNGENKTSPPMHLSVASECAARSDSAGAGGEVGATLGAGRVQGGCRASLTRVQGQRLTARGAGRCAASLAPPASACGSVLVQCP